MKLGVPTPASCGDPSAGDRPVMPRVPKTDPLEWMDVQGWSGRCSPEDRDRALQALEDGPDEPQATALPLRSGRSRGARFSEDHERALDGV
jgi:hypothetical protein